VSDRRPRPRPYSYADFEERVEAAVRLGIARGLKHQDKRLPDAAVEAIADQVTREVMNVAADLVAFPEEAL
jgi:hypothetical protein